MAPLSFPEEVDVFSIPHSRMKELVNKYLEMLTETNFDDAFRMTSLLESLSTTFKEFKAHEQIENRCILRKLKRKLRALSITNTAVCNCHKDNQLTEMMSLFRDGYRCTRKTAADRINYGIKLRRALEQFTDQFIPHMKEEEEVFQPLLMQYFTYEELRELKALVLQEHWRTVAEEGEAKLVEDSLSSESSCDEEESSDKGHYSPFDLLPDELLLKIFSTLSPRDLGICACVNKRSNQLATDPELWTDIFPVHWAKGDWTFSPRPDSEDEPMSQKEFSSAVLDEDADVDESMDGDNSESDAFFEQLKDEARLLSGLTKHLLPKVGSGVKTLSLANSVGLTNGTLYKMLVQCPNVEDLNLTQTRVSDVAFKGLGRNGCGLKLRHINLSGCEKVTDLTLQRLASAIRQPQGSLGASSSSSTCLQQPSNNSSDDQTLESEKSRKTLRNDKFVRTKQSCDTDSNSHSSSSTEECDVRTNTSGCLPTKFDQSHCSGVLAEGLQRPVPDSCRQLLAGIQQLERSFSELTFCPCPFARKKFTENSESSASSVDGFSTTTEGYDLSEPVQQSNKVAFPCDEMKKYSAQDCSPICDNSKGDLNVTWKAASSLVRPSLLSLNLSGCWLVTDNGLRLLASQGGLPALTRLDLSGCLSITAAGLAELVEACPNLDHAHLYYCDNLEDDPYPATASGCQNLACNSRVCCRSGN